MIVCTSVVEGVMKKAEEYYRSLVLSGNVVTEFDIPAEHSMVSSFSLTVHHLISAPIGKILELH